MNALSVLRRPVPVLLSAADLQICLVRCTWRLASVCVSTITTLVKKGKAFDKGITPEMLINRLLLKEDGGIWSQVVEVPLKEDLQGTTSHFSGHSSSQNMTAKWLFSCLGHRAMWHFASQPEFISFKCFIGACTSPSPFGGFYLFIYPLIYLFIWISFREDYMDKHSIVVVNRNLCREV